MNEDDLLKGGRAAALPNGTEAGLVSHVTFHKRYRSSNFDLLVLGKRRELSFDELFGIFPIDYCEEGEEHEAGYDLADFVPKVDEGEMNDEMLSESSTSINFFGTENLAARGDTRPPVSGIVI